MNRAKVSFPDYKLNMIYRLQKGKEPQEKDNMTARSNSMLRLHQSVMYCLFTLLTDTAGSSKSVLNDAQTKSKAF